MKGVNLLPTARRNQTGFETAYRKFGVIHERFFFLLTFRTTWIPLPQCAMRTADGSRKEILADRIVSLPAQGILGALEAERFELLP